MKIYETKNDRVFLYVIYSILALASLFIIYPLIYVVSASLSNPIDLVNGKVWLFPVNFTLDAYTHVFENEQIWIGFRNTVIYTLVGTSLNLLLSIMIAYPLSRKDLVGRNIIMIILLITMFFNGGLVPTYLIIRKLGLVNTFWAMIIPSAVNTYNVIVMRTFFETSIPNELRESAVIDGSSNLAFLLKIVLPLSGPIIAVMILFYGVYHWNEFFTALIYLSNRKLFPLQLILREILVQTQTDGMIGSGAGFTERIMRSEILKYAVIIISSLPMLVLYPFLQRYFVKGVMIGAIKG